ncbi:MAG: hypothetical protein M3389_10995 [Actinomycetota bacterium]|nr:hypothetical protein [Actinomycetota bacterium]
MTHPLTARLVLLAAAAALAASVVFALIVAEHRDIDARAKGASLAPLTAEARAKGVDAVPVRVSAKAP